MLAQALDLRQDGVLLLLLPVPAQVEVQARGGAQVRIRAPDGVIHRTQVQTAGVPRPLLHPPVLQQAQMPGVHRQPLVLPLLQRVQMPGVHHRPLALPLLQQAHGVSVRRTLLDGAARAQLRLLDGEARAHRRTAGMYSNIGHRLRRHRLQVVCLSCCILVFYVSWELYCTVL